MKRVLQVVLVAVIALAALGYFLAGWLLKSAIEREGSQALRAELNLASVDLHLFPLGLTLHDVQVTNPQQPLRNLVTIERADAAFAFDELLDRRVVADTVQLRGLRFNQLRLRSGAIAGLTPPVQPVAVAAGRSALALPPIDAAATVPPAPVPAAGLTQALIGAEFAPLIEQIRGLANLAQGAQDEAQPAWPALARTVELDGRIDIGAQPLAFTGVIHNATPQPRFWDVATDIALQAAPEQPARFAFNGTLDQRNGVVMDARLTLAGLPLAQLPLSRGEPLEVDLNAAVLDVEGLLRMEGHQIDFGLFGLFRQASLRIEAGADPLAQRLSAALRTINQFDINVLMVGDVGAPRVQLQSSLDPILAAAINEQLRRQYAVPPGAGF
jgi:hypothetical protein